MAREGRKGAVPLQNAVPGNPEIFRKRNISYWN